MLKKLAVLLFAVACSGLLQAGDAVVDRPEKLNFGPLTFEVPDPGSMRFELSDGTPVYLQEDHALPLVHLTIFFHGGRYLIPADKAGLAAIAGEVWRSGGAGEMNAQDFDEALDFLAADLRANIGDVQGSVNLDVMSKDLDEAMTLAMTMITQPRFQKDRFDKAKEDLLQEMKRRNDNTASIESREWNRLIYGDDYWLNHLPVQSSVDNLSIDDCRNFIGPLLRSGNLVLALSGDINREEAVALLEKQLSKLPKMDETLPAIPQPEKSAAPGVYVVNKPDVNQGRVRIGQLGYKEGFKDEFPLQVGNDILGGGGFTSRMMKTIRSNEGLAYGAYSSMRFNRTLPGMIMAFFQSKSSTCAYATKIAFDLIRQMQSEMVEPEELQVSKASFVETFPRRFESAQATASLYAMDELLGRDHAYWKNYRSSVSAVTADGIQRAMAEDVHPDQMIVLVVGNIADIMKGHPDHAAKMTDFGEIHELPLRDPLTLQ